MFHGDGFAIHIPYEGALARLSLPEYDNFYVFQKNT
jgi:hypothetical protein